MPFSVELRVLGFADDFEVADVIVFRISVFMVDIVPFGDGAVVVLPDCAMQPYVVTAEILFMAVFVVFLAVENLVRVSMSPARSFDKCFHSLLQ